MATMHTSVKSILWTFLVSAGVARAQQLDPIDNMCVRLHHQSVVKNNTLYIDGGRETFIDVTGSGGDTKQTGRITEGYNNYLITIDMSSSWDWKTNISESALTKTKVPQTGTFPPNLNQGALFHGADGDDNIYLMGGTTSYWNTSFPGFAAPYPAQYSLWSYNISGQSWGQHDITFGSPNRPNSGSSTEARDQGLAFYFNGQIDYGSEQATVHLGNNVDFYLEGMIVLDTNNQTAKNLSTKAVVGDTPRSRGEMQYIEDLGGKGILVQIGGNQKDVGDTDNSPTSNLVPMNQVDVFDVSSIYNPATPDGVWYKQNTSGDVPAGRIDFCMVLASAGDGSSHNIYMYGGRGVNGTESVFFDEIWVLSLPSFTWNKIYEGTSPRYGHSCHRVGSRTMLTVGGAENLQYNVTPCDWELKGVGVLDMSAVTWGSVYDANAADYTVPNLVASRIGSVNGGAAKMTQPKNGFDDAGLAAIFNSNTTVNGTTNAPGNNNTTTSAPGSAPPQAPSKKNIIGPVVGGVIGGLALITILAALLHLYRKQVKRLLLGPGIFPFSELGPGREKAENELLGSNEAARWELSGAGRPVEIESPVVRESSRGRVEMDSSARVRRSKGEGGVKLREVAIAVGVELPSSSEIMMATTTPTRGKRNTVDRDKPLPIVSIPDIPYIPKLLDGRRGGGGGGGGGGVSDGRRSEGERTLYDHHTRGSGSSMGTTTTTHVPMDEKTWI